MYTTYMEMQAALSMFNVCWTMHPLLPTSPGLQSNTGLRSMSDLTEMEVHLLKLVASLSSAVSQAVSGIGSFHSAILRLQSGCHASHRLSLPLQSLLHWSGIMQCCPPRWQHTVCSLQQVIGHCLTTMLRHRGWPSLDLCR